MRWYMVLWNAGVVRPNGAVWDNLRVLFNYDSSRLRSLMPWFNFTVWSKSAKIIKKLNARRRMQLLLLMMPGNQLSSVDYLRGSEFAAWRCLPSAVKIQTLGAERTWGDDSDVASLFPSLSIHPKSHPPPIFVLSFYMLFGFAHSRWCQRILFSKHAPAWR